MTAKPPAHEPFKSVAQRDKWRQLVQDGRLTPAQFHARESVTDVKNLPPRLHPRKHTVGPSRSFDAAPIGHTKW